MKTLKFYPHLVKQIVEGEKTSTWRLFDDKDLRENDVVSFINKETGEVFGTATITSLIVKTFGTLEKNDWLGHEKFASEEEMYETYRNYYGDKVNPDSEVKILIFDFTPITGK